MAGTANQYEALIVRLAADPDLSVMARPGAGVLVWNRAVDKVLWASPAAQGLRDALTDEKGRITPALRARDRLKVLSANLASSGKARLERLRLDPTRPWLPVTCACRLASLGNGEIVLVTVLTGPVPRLAARTRPALPSSETSGLQDDEAVSRSESATPQKAARSTIRFVWQADAETRFTHVTPGLAEAVGPRAADIVGKTWEDVSRSVAVDADGVIASLFARCETWGGRTIFWNIDNSSMQVPVDWGGMPIFGAGRELIGFRGFGLLRMDALREREIPEEIAEDVSQSEPAAGSDRPEDENWFSTLRDRVAEALSGHKRSESESSADAETARDAASSLDRPAPTSSSLSHAERNAFREIARALGARLEESPPSQGLPPTEEPPAAPMETSGPEVMAPEPLAAPANGDQVLDRLPIGVLVHRGERVIFANRFLLELTGYEGVGQIQSEGGLLRLFQGSPVLGGSQEDGPPLALTTCTGENIPVEVRPSAAEWDGDPAQLMVIRRIAEEASPGRELDNRIHELESILDTATDGVIVFDERGCILSLNRSAEALFGYDQQEVVGSAITVLLAPESHMVALAYLEGLRSHGVASLLNDGREVLGRERQGGTIPLFMTVGRVSDGPDRKFCAVLRDITSFKRAEGELVGARRAAEEASAQKSDLLAKISHEIRTPLNAIIGFAEVMLEERFGPVGNERYKEYLRDVHASGSHVISLVNDLLDLAKIEAGRLELAFTGVNLNELVSACVALLQPQAARARIVMRTSFAEKLPPVVADERSVRQILLNLISNAIKFTDAGGQVIVSTALTDQGEVAIRVRDTGIGMTEQEIEAALEPFRQLATSRKRGGTGLGLPLTKALVEANRGALQIESHPNEGTLVAVIFPPTRVLAE